MLYKKIYIKLLQVFCDIFQNVVTPLIDCQYNNQIHILSMDEINIGGDLML